MKKKLNEILIILGIIVIIWLIYLCGGFHGFIWFVINYFTWIIPIVPLAYAIQSIQKKQLKKTFVSTIVFVLLTILYLYYSGIIMPTGSYFIVNTLVIREMEGSEVLQYEVDNPDVIKVIDDHGSIINPVLYSRITGWRISGEKAGDCTFTVQFLQGGVIKYYNVYYIHVDNNKKITYNFERVDEVK